MRLQPTAVKAALPALALLLAACGSTPPRVSQPAPVATSTDHILRSASRSNSVSGNCVIKSVLPSGDHE